MKRQDAGGAALSVLLFATVIAALVMTALSVRSSVATTIQARRDSSQAYWLARTDALAALKQLKAGKALQDSTVSCPIGNVVRVVHPDDSIITVITTARTAFAVHAVEFQFDSGTHAVKKWQDDMLADG